MQSHVTLLKITILFAIVAIYTFASTSPCNALGKETPPLSPDDQKALAQILQQADGDLRNDVLPFWTKSTWDSQYGGYLTVVDRYGKPTADGHKWLVMQARMIWTLSAAHRYGIHDKGYLEMAGKAVKYVTTHMWDSKYKGFYMSVKRDGTPDDTRKYTYSQEFVVFGLAEYALVSGDRHALEWAERTYAVIKAKAGDGILGFHEDFDRQWNRLPGSLGVTGVETGKTLNTHMHMMEALTALVDAANLPQYRAELARVTDLLLAKTINTKYGCAMEPFDRFWHPVPDLHDRMSTYYAHNVELAWLLLDAYRALGRPRESIKPVFFGLIDHALAHGFDLNYGGLAAIGPYDRSVFTDTEYFGDNRYNEWWEQAEAMVAFTEAYQWSRDPKYLSAMLKEWDWIWKFQIDHEGGDWYTEVKHSGEPASTDKAMGGWKCCYHNGRSLMRVSTAIREILKEIATTTSTP